MPEDKNEIVVKEDLPIVQIQEMSPMQTMMALSDKGVNLDKIEKMIELQEKYESIQAKKAFTIAMTLFKSDAPIITRDKENKQYGSFYTTLGNLVNSSLPKMSECGLSHRWDVKQEDTIEVTCIVTHKMGHEEPTTMKAPPDTSGSKNPIQQIKSTVTYLKSATFESAMGLASTDANIDDDGNGASTVKLIDEKQKGVIIDMIADCDGDTEEFLTWLGYDSIDEVQEKSYKRAVAALKLKKEKNDASNN